MIITITPELVKPLKATANKFGLTVDPQETEYDGQYQVHMPDDWGISHWFDFGLQAGLDFQLKSSLAIND